MPIDSSSTSYKYDPVYHRFADYMGIDVFGRRDLEVAKKLSLLYEWAEKKAGTDDFSKVTKILDNARRQEGVSFTGGTLVNYMHQRVRVEIDNMPKKVEMSATKQDRYDVDKGRGRDYKESQQKPVKDAKAEDKLAKKKSMEYIRNYRESIPKPKLEKIPVRDAIGTIPDK